jgi:hypothetical protein
VVIDESVRELGHLRSQARRLGLTIRTQGTIRTTGSRVYSLRDRETGQVISSDLTDLADVQTRLWWIVRDRRRALTVPSRVAPMPKDQCPMCGTPRLAFFRLCTSCGLDYEASREPTPHVGPRPPWKGPKGRLVRQPTPRGAISGDSSARPSIGARLTGFAHDIARGRRLGVVRVIVWGAAIGLLVGALVALVLTQPK